MARRAGHRLGQHAALQVEHAGGDVAGLATEVRKAVRTSVCACSSTTAIRRFHMICSWICASAALDGPSWSALASSVRYNPRRSMRAAKPG